MKVFCIENEKLFSISSNSEVAGVKNGKIYDVISESSHYYKLMCDSGQIFEFTKSKFISLSKYRIIKLEQLGI